MSEILKALVIASERAASVARACCGNDSNAGALVVAEKSAGEANTRFAQDFKTLADVLAQEVAKMEITNRCSISPSDVRGEECAEINGVQIELGTNPEETIQMLEKLVNRVAAERLSEAVHGTSHLPIIDDIPCDLPALDTSDLGVWIDPIDSTAEFIAGARGENAENQGLSCVTVLLGAYLKTTGEPVIGVINQPFYGSKGRIVWGACYDGIKVASHAEIPNTTTRSILTSSAESPDIIHRLEDGGWSVNNLPGAGHKLLRVSLGDADACIVSRSTTFRWDTCAPHALLRAHGGDILCFKTRQPLTYNDPKDIETQYYCNSGGILAYRHYNTIHLVNDVLK